MAAAACEVSMMDVDVCSPGPLSATYQKDLMAISEDSYYYNQNMEVECEEFMSSFNNRDAFMLLPEELVYAIFCFLHGSDICNTVQKVCRSWRRLAKDDRVSKTTKPSLFASAHFFVHPTHLTFLSFR